MKKNSFWQKDQWFSRESLNSLLGIGLGIILALNFTASTASSMHARRILYLVALIALLGSVASLITKGKK